MRVLARNFPIAELLAHFIIIGITLVSYGYLLAAAYILPIPSGYNYVLADVFQKFVSPDPVFPGSNSPWCNTGSGMMGFVSIAERGSQCQLSFTDFTKMCYVFGLRMTEAEKRIFFNTLDITGNGMVSFGELTVDYFNTSQPAFIYYVSRWKSWRYAEAKTYGSGLERVEGFNYEPFRWDNTTRQFSNQGTWGPLGVLA